MSLKVLLENLLRFEDGISVGEDDLKAFAAWLDNKGAVEHEISFRPARVLMQDFTGVPAVVDLAAMRDAMAKLGADPAKINPLVPGRPGHRPLGDGRLLRHRQAPSARNVDKRVRAQPRALPLPALGLVGLQQLPRRAARHRHLPPGEPGIPGPDRVDRPRTATTTSPIPDTVVGTDSHTTMVNGLSVLGWGVGGIEAEAAMLGQPIPMLIPEVIGFKLTGALPEGATATDLVLTVTQMLRKKGVVGKFVEFFGAGLGQPDHRGPGHHRQHGPGIRRHLRLLPGHPGDASTI